MTPRRSEEGRRLRAALLPLLAGATLGLPAVAAAQQYLYVVSQDDVSVGVIHMATNDLVATVNLRALGYSPTAKPHHVVVEPDGSYWYVSLIAAGKVLKFDRDNQLVGEAPMETPGMLALDPRSDYLYAARSMAAVNPPQRIGMVRRSTMEIVEVDVFLPRPHALAIDSRRSRVFAASLVENRIAYAPLGAEEVDILAYDGPMHMPVQLTVSPDGRWLVTGGQMSGDLLIFDLAGPTPTLVRAVAVGGQPWHPVFTPDGATLWIPNQAANTVTVIDVEDWSEVAVLEHPALAEPHGSAVSPDGRTVYVSSHNANGSYVGEDGRSHPGTVVVIDVATRSVVGVVEVGRFAVGMGAPSGAPRH